MSYLCVEFMGTSDAFAMHSPQEKSTYIRQLKVRKGHYFYQHGDFQPRHRHRNCKPVPWIQVKCYWLNQAGFSVGILIRVRVRQGCLVLKAI